MNNIQIDETRDEMQFSNGQRGYQLKRKLKAAKKDGHKHRPRGFDKANRPR